MGCVDNAWAMPARPDDGQSAKRSGLGAVEMKYLRFGSFEQCTKPASRHQITQGIDKVGEVELGHGDSGMTQLAHGGPGAWLVPVGAYNRHVEAAPVAAVREFGDVPERTARGHF